MPSGIQPKAFFVLRSLEEMLLLESTWDFWIKATHCSFLRAHTVSQLLHTFWENSFRYKIRCFLAGKTFGKGKKRHVSLKLHAHMVLSFPFHLDTTASTVTASSVANLFSHRHKDTSEKGLTNYMHLYAKANTDEVRCFHVWRRNYCADYTSY